MKNHDILDQHFRRERTEEEDSEFRRLRLDAVQTAHRIQHGRYALYVICAICLLIGAVLLFADDDIHLFGNEYAANFELAIILLLTGGLYVGLAWASFPYPKIALGLATGIYLLSQIVGAIENPASLFRGVIVKVVIIYYLIKAFQSSLHLERIKKRSAELGATGEELTG